jgi:Fe-S-cluster containining protein
MIAKAKHYAKIYKRFSASISEQFDCGRMCAPLNGGEPVCCSTQHAVPIVTTHEYELLKKRAKMWHRFKPFDRDTRQIVKELDSGCKAIECEGARHCERDNRTLACRSFPFFPYLTKEKELIGLSYYWSFEDRCWVISNLSIVEQEFIDEIINVHEYLFKKDEDEKDAFLEQSASMRRVFSRQNRVIPIIGCSGDFFKVLPKSGGKVLPAKAKDFKPHGPFVSDKAYCAEIKLEGGNPKGKTLEPDWSIKDWWNHV